MIDPTLQQLLADILGVDPEDITLDSTMDDFPQWDSIKHLELITTIENTFNVRFEMANIPTLTSVSAIMKALGK